MIAQIQNVTPGFLHQAALLAFGLLAGAAAVVGMYAALRKRKIEPQPLEVSAAAVHPTEKEFAARQAAVEQRLEALEAGIQDVQRVQREQIGNVHRRIDDMLTVVSRLGGVIEGVQEALRNLHNDLTNLRRK